MIIFENGHYRSVRTPEEEESRFSEEIEGLSDEEREVLRKILEDPSLGSKYVGALAKSEYERIPVDIHTFIHDEYYLGNTCDGLYPKWEEDLEEIFSGGYSEIIFTGAIGVGKTFVASVGVCRVLYELSCMADPHASLGVARNTNISIVGFSVNEQLAMKVVLENIATKIGGSPYFKEHFPFQVTKKELRFPKNIWVAARASTDTSVLGLNVIGAILDEANFQQRSKSPKRVGEVIDRAQVLYTQIRRRMKSRFERNGRMPGKLFLLSSKDSTSDFTEKRIQESKDDPSVFVRDYPLWGPKPRDHFSDETFGVLVGNENTLSKILSDEEYAHFKEHGPPEGCLLVDVPDNFKIDFEQDLEGSIRDICGIATVAVSPFIQRRDKILEMRDDSIPVPFSAEFLDPSVGGRFLWDRLVKVYEERLPGTGGAYEKVPKPILHPDALRHVHVDIGVTKDALGICMAHRWGEKSVERKLPDGRVVSERAPLFWTDLVLRVVPPVGGEIYIPDIRTMILEFVRRGYPIAKVTSDSYQSVSLLQEIRKQGIPSEVLSVDKTMDPYQTLKLAIYEGRVRVYEYPYLFLELQKLQIDKSKPDKPKVDHPINFTKDVSDALAGAIYTLANADVGGAVPILVGSGRMGASIFEGPDQAEDFGDPPILFG